MHHAVSSYELTSVDLRSHPQGEMAFLYYMISEAVRFSIKLTYIFIIALSYFCLGCSSSFSTIPSKSSDEKPDSSFISVDDPKSFPRDTVNRIETIIEKPPLDSNSTVASTENNPAIDRHKMLTEILLMAGIHYRMYGMDTSGMDCSGFTLKIFLLTLGIRLPHSSHGQYTLGKAVDRDSLKFGDLIFFNMSGRSPSHVGIFVGDGFFAHASVSMGVTISILESEFYKNRFLGARRIVE